jgi:cell division protein FtsB
VDKLKELLKELNDNEDTYRVFLREIARLTDKNEELKDRVREKEKEIKNLLKHIKGENV